MIEPVEVTAVAVQKTEPLDKEFRDRNTLFVFAHQTKHPFDSPHQLTVWQILSKQSQSGTGCHPVVSLVQ